MVVSTEQLPSSQPGELEAHFAALLEPIRDLAKNWNIDIAHHLEEYLEELDKVQFSFDGGITTMNFSQAAFVIQKSACVYSKKVESLYVLVYQVLDLISSKKKMAQAASVDAEGTDENVVSLNKGDPEEEFLTLDDVKLPKNIEGKRSDEDITVMIPRTPMSLIPMDEGEKGQNPLLSRTGDVLGSRRDFRLNTSNLHTCGTMLLDMSHVDQLELSLAMRPTSTPVGGHVVTRLARDMALDKDKTLSSIMGEVAQPPNVPEDVNMNDDENDAFGMDLPPDDAMPVEDAPNQSGMQLRPRSRVEQMAQKPPKVVVDPWTELDDHEIAGSSEKQLRKGKTSRIPKGLETDETKKRKRRQPAAASRLKPINQFCAKAFHSSKTKMPGNELKAPRFSEFEELYWAEFRWRQKRLKDDKKLMMRRGSIFELAEVEGEGQQQNDIVEMARPAEEEDILEDDFEIPALGDPVINLLRAGAVEEHVPVETTVDLPVIDVSGESVVASYEDLVRQYVDGFLASAQQYAKITELSRRVSEWEDKIFPKLRQEELNGPFDIHKYGTKILHSFVTTRRKRKAVEADSQETTDADVSSTDLENAAGKVIPFRSVCSGRPAFDVSRLFLASLQLANTYNIEIGSEGVLESGMDTMTVKLLSTKRHFEELEEYRAPSLQT